MADPQKQSFTDVQPIDQQPQGFWDRVSAALKPRNPLDMPGAKAITAKEAFSSAHPNPGSSEGANFAEALHDYDKASGGELAGGVVDILHGNVAKGLHRIIGGVSAGITPAMPLMAPAMAAAPIKTALSVAGGIGGAKAASSGAQALGANPEQAALAGDVGGITGGIIAPEVPALARGIGGRALLLGKTPQEAYQSALKPSTTIRPERVANIVQTGLQEGIPVSKAGQEKLAGLIDNVNDKIAAEIGSGKGVTINPMRVATRADQVKGRFATQVNPTSDLEAIEASKQEFLANQEIPPARGIGPSNLRQIPATEAQAMKQGTYQQLKGKAYGELKSASIEAQKALARGLKEEIADAFPELKQLNARDSKLYDLQPILDKAVQREANHQIAGIGTPILAGGTKAVTGSTGMAAIAGLLKAVVDNPNVKSRLAISLSRAGGLTFPDASARVAAYSAALAASANNALGDDQTNQ